MPTPQRMYKNIILWVDDIPKNNLQYLSYFRSDIDIIPLISTQMAELWMK